MKKIISIILASVMAFSLMACGTTETKVEERTVTLVGEQNGANVEYTMYGKGDQVDKIVQVMTTNVSAYEETDLQMAIANVKLQYDSIMGVSYDSNVANGILTETITMDFTSPSTAKAISEAGLMKIDGEGTISFAKTIENMKTLGFTEK